MTDSSLLRPSAPMTRRRFVALSAAGVGLTAAGCGRQPAPETPVPAPETPAPVPGPPDLSAPPPAARAGSGEYDAVVVGGSFAGLSAALQLARARRTVLLLDAGKPRNRFARRSHGFLGQDGRPPAELVADARRQLLKYLTVRYEPAEATEAAREGDRFRVVFGGREAVGRRLVLATGVVDHLPAVPGLADRWGEGVLQCPYCHGYEVAGRRLGVLATGEPSVHQAKLIPDWGEDVTLFTNGAVALTADDRAALAARKVKVVEGRVAGVRGPGRAVEAVELAGGGVVPLDALFVVTRTTLASPLAEKLGCAVEAGRFGPVVTTDALKETTVKGVYAAGDAARAIHNATWAAADGVSAGIFAHQSLVVAANPYHKGK